MGNFLGHEFFFFVKLFLEISSLCIFLEVTHTIKTRLVDGTCSIFTDGSPCLIFPLFFHREPTQAASLVVCSKYKELYGNILKNLTIVKFYRGMSKLKVEVNVNLPQLQLLCIVVSVALSDLEGSAL